MAGGAFSLLVTGSHELSTVNVFVTLVAQRGRLREIGRRPRLRIDGDRCSLCDDGRTRRPMTSDACCCLMCTFQGESGCAVVECAERFPLGGVMARFAILPGVVRIDMTSCAALVGEMILARSHGDSSFQRLMAVRADNRKVGSCEREPGLLVFGQRESRRVKRRLCMTGLAFIRVRLRGELGTMRVRVATLAGVRRELILRIRAGGLVAACTRSTLVLTFQLERALLMVLDRVKGRLKALLVMARRAVTACGACRKLPLMNVFMAVGAHFMRHGLAEITVGVTFEARDVAVFAEQRKLCSSMVKACVGFKRLPSRRYVAIGAAAGERGVLKRSFRGVGMAVVTAGIAEFPILRHRFPAPRLVAA